jgi:hypothetical protein
LAARLTAAPLINLSPLKGCHVRFGRTPHRELKDIARDSVLQALETINAEDQKSTSSNTTMGTDSKLMSLPPELRFLYTRVH